MIKLEHIPHRLDRRYFLLYNSNVLAILIHYAFFISNLQSSKPVIHHFRNAQMCLHTIYIILYSVAMRTSHPTLYMDVLKRRRSYLYWLLHLYFIYAFLYEDSIITAFAGNFCITIHWNEHVHTLQQINYDLLEN